MNELELTLAINDYDHTRDLVHGIVPVPGIRLRPVVLPPPEINGRMTLHREWHVAEFGLGKYAALRAAGDDELVAIPVFPARAFRQSCIYVRTESDLGRPEDLAGRRVGIPEWAQTAVTYVRGFMVHQHGVDLVGIEWHQAGVNRPGRVEKVTVRPPAGTRIVPHPDNTLERLLATGAVDALVTAQPPDAFVAGEPWIRRLYADPRAAEQAYFRATGVFPIMHGVAIRRDILDQHPWVAIELLKGFETARARSLTRLRDAMFARLPLAWAEAATAAEEAVFGPDLYPYGIEPNRATLAAFLGFAHEQGVAERLLTIEEIFAPTTLRPIRQ